MFIVALEPDPFFAIHIDSAAKRAGAQPLIVSTGAALWEAIERWPELILINLDANGWEEPVRRAKNLPHTRAIPIVAHGSPVETDLLRTARKVGVDHAWTQSRFTSELPELIKETLHPTTRWLEGWDAAPSATLCKGIAQFNAGEYWECHETLENLWIAESRPIRDLYQGILQIGIALHHLTQDNFPGAIKMFRRGLPRLRGLPEICQGVQVAELSAVARQVHDTAMELGEERIAEMNVADFPVIVMVDPR